MSTIWSPGRFRIPPASSSATRLYSWDSSGAAGCAECGGDPRSTGCSTARTIRWIAAACRGTWRCCWGCCCCCCCCPMRRWRTSTSMWPERCAWIRPDWRSEFRSNEPCWTLTTVSAMEAGNSACKYKQIINPDRNSKRISGGARSLRRRRWNRSKMIPGWFVLTSLVVDDRSLFKAGLGGGGWRGGGGRSSAQLGTRWLLLLFWRTCFDSGWPTRRNQSHNSPEKPNQSISYPIQLLLHHVTTVWWLGSWRCKGQHT